MDHAQIRKNSEKESITLFSLLQIWFCEEEEIQVYKEAEAEEEGYSHFPSHGSKSWKIKLIQVDHQRIIDNKLEEDHSYDALC